LDSPKAISTKAMRCSFDSIEDGVQPPVAAEPGEGPFNHPADAGRNEPSIAAAGNRFDGDAECLAGFGQPLTPATEIAERRTLEAVTSERAQNLDNAFGVVPICRRRGLSGYVV
jgi:hypothetical protein